MKFNKSALKYFIIYKPYNVLSQFTSTDQKSCLGDLYNFPKDVYPVGRLDEDSEGLLLLTNDKALNHQLLNPLFAHKRSYLVQVEGKITPEALHQLSAGVNIKINNKTYYTLPALATPVETAIDIPVRVPPVRFRKNDITSWIMLTLTEGKNRQVRKMTASTGYPTLRLIRYSIENIVLGDMQPGDVNELSQAMVYHKLNLGDKLK